MPQNNAVQSHYFSGQGILLVAEKDAVTGEPKGFYNVGNVADLKITTKTNTIEHKETSTGARGVDFRLTTEVGCGVTAMLEDFSQKNLLMALRADGSDIVAGTAKTFKGIAYPGTTFALPHVGISVVSAETTAATPVPLVLDTDYTINSEAGSINILAGSAVVTAGGVEIEVTYDHTAQTDIQALTQPFKNYVLRFEGMNTADENKPVVVTVHKFSSDPLKELALISDKLNDITLEGTGLADLTRPAGVSKYFSVVRG